MAAAASHAVAVQRQPLGPYHHHDSRPFDALSTDAMLPVKAQRSKRARSSAWCLLRAPRFPDSSSSWTTTTSSSSSSSAFWSPGFDGGYHHHFLAPLPQKKPNHGNGGGKNGGNANKRGRKPKKKKLSGAAATSVAASQLSAAQGDRRCSHCGVQKTPQWRPGPEGTKTLCNACGVRYKSGRLLPEYRPACSPTFMSSIHSNSHRKVLEMRCKKEAGLVASAAVDAPQSSPLEELST